MEKKKTLICENVMMKGVRDWIVSLKILHFEVLMPKGTSFADKAFKEVIKFKWGHKCEVLIQ